MALTLAELGGFDLYRDLISLLDGLPRPDIEGLHGFSDRFGPRGDAKSFPVFCFLLSNWLHRALRSQIDGQNIVPVFAGEDEVAARFVSRAGTDALLGLWGKSMMARARLKPLTSIASKLCLIGSAIWATCLRDCIAA